MAANENITTTESGAEVYEDQILYWMDQFKEQYNIKNFDDIDQSKWNACLKFVNMNYIKPNKKMLKSREYIQTGNLLNGNPSTLNVYNLDILHKIADLYIYLCFTTSHEVSIYGYCSLTGIDDTVVNVWKDTEPSNPKNKLYKKLCISREETLSDRLYSGKANPVGILGILNRHYGWNMGQPRDNSQNVQQSIESIQEKYQIAGIPTAEKPADID